MLSGERSESAGAAGYTNLGANMKNILGLIILISRDNGIPMKPFDEIRFPHGIGVDWKKLDEQASTLNTDQAETFCCGEVTDMNALITETGFIELHRVLHEIFDGDLGQYFWAV